MKTLAFVILVVAFLSKTESVVCQSSSTETQTPIQTQTRTQTRTAVRGYFADMGKEPAGQRQVMIHIQWLRDVPIIRDFKIWEEHSSAPRLVDNFNGIRRVQYNLARKELTISTLSKTITFRVEDMKMSVNENGRVRNGNVVSQNYSLESYLSGNIVRTNLGRDADKCWIPDEQAAVRMPIREENPAASKFPFERAQILKFRGSVGWGLLGSRSIEVDIEFVGEDVLVRDLNVYETDYASPRRKWAFADIQSVGGGFSTEFVLKMRNGDQIGLNLRDHRIGYRTGPSLLQRNGSYQVQGYDVPAYMDPERVYHTNTEPNEAWAIGENKKIQSPLIPRPQSFRLSCYASRYQVAGHKTVDQ